MQGAKQMIDAGVLNNPTTDAALALYVIFNMKNGTFTCKKGAVFHLLIGRVGAHSTEPDLAIDPLLVITQV